MIYYTLRSFQETENLSEKDNILNPSKYPLRF